MQSEYNFIATNKGAQFSGGGCDNVNWYLCDRGYLNYCNCSTQGTVKGAGAGGSIKPAKFSGLFDDIIKGINAGLNIFKATGGSVGGGGSASTKISGAAISQAAAQILGQAQQALAALQSGQISPTQAAQVVAQSHTLLVSLFDSNIFDTDHSGSTLKPFQDQAVSLGQQIQTAADAVISGAIAYHPTGTTIDPTTGQPVATSTTSIFSDPIVIYGGLGLLAFMLLNKK